MKVAIIGGGLAGLSLAAALKPSSHLRLVLIEQRPLQKATATPAPLSIADRRSSALSYSSQQILARLGVWDGLSAAAAPINNIIVSERGEFGQVEMTASDCELEALGHVVPNDVLGGALLQRALASHGDALQLCSPAKLSDLKQCTRGWELVIEAETGELRDEFDLLVFADGGQIAERFTDTLQQSSAAKAVFQRQRYDYRQTAIIANIRSRSVHGGRAHERFLKGGALALLPLAGEGNQWYSLVLTLGLKEAEIFTESDDQQFIEQIQSLAGFDPGVLDRVEGRQSYPLSKVEMPCQVGPAAVVIGNAAHTLHPVAGQGFNLTLRDLDVLGRLLSRVVNGQSPLDNVLQQYQQLRRPDQKILLEVTDLLVELFMLSETNSSLERSDQWLPAIVVSALRRSRRAGFAMLNTMPLASRAFAEAAMGLWVPQSLSPLRHGLTDADDEAGLAPEAGKRASTEEVS